GHAGTLQQNGNGNAHGLFQFGEGTNADVVQNGNGEVGATVQIGW
ncbi:MAG: curlin, partial [Hyphomicrobiales bacterium]|nr:curlin [Hyphomicrobiales bacterium]